MYETGHKNAARSDLFERIGRFLQAQALLPDPANYALAHAALSDPDGAVAKAVARLTDGGVRLNGADVARLGGNASVPKDKAGAGGPDRAQDLVVQTQQQVDGFAGLVARVQAETTGFGAELAASAAQMTAPGRSARSGEEIARIAAAMVARLREAETRLAAATEETDALRAKLAEARDSARRDPLTGLANRRAFDEALAARVDGDGPHMLAICDIDHFKRFNDRHGHAVGDRVLRVIAQGLAASCKGHLVARYGGEEFAVLMTGLSLAGANAMLDGARVEAGAKRFRNRENDDPIGKITFSAGITGVARGEDAAAAFDRADRLLYTAKVQGRDRICGG